MSGTARVPVEYVGLARAFRTTIAAEYPRAIAVIDRLSIPLAGRWRLRQPPSATAFPKIANAWRDDAPSAGRLNLVISVTKHRLAIAETRAGPCKFRFQAWDEGDTETSIAITETTMLASTERFQFDCIPVATLPLHALARRYQRGRDNSDAAIYADLLALSRLPADTSATGNDFAVPLPEGRWVGSVTEINDRGNPLPILTVRSFISDEMMSRADAPAEAAA